MRLVVGDTVRTGRALDGSDLDLTPAGALDAIRDSGPEGVRIETADPGPAHEFVGCVRPGTRLSLRPALAAAARSRGASTPQDDRIEELRERLDALDTDPASTRAERRAVAETGVDVERLQERVAELRGRVQALEDAGLDAADARAELAETVQRLSEAETERIAAAERLDRAMSAAREARDARERRLRLEDELANREREARAALVERVEADYADAVAAVPGVGGTDDTDAFALADGDPVTAALAVARVADLTTPVVLVCDRFETPARAADWLDAPVLSL